MDREEWRPRQSSVGGKKDDGVARSSRVLKEGSNAVRRRKSIGPVVVEDNGEEGGRERETGGGGFEARNANRSRCTMKQKQL